ncbi:hypothetical protein AB5N19_10049 [Seiridium cardinale]|uniref:Uncharacterized protein n=1 Tax=Seiridium cardinale TaxID=138064 RepID=A0ABR2YAH0_9PEZI
MFTLMTCAVATMLLGLSQAAPAIPRQDIKLLLLCNDPNQVDCLDFQVTPDVCSNIPGDSNDNVSSLDTGGDSSLCTFYNNPECDGGAGSIQLAGIHDSLPTGFDNTLSSIKCNICLIPEGCA